MKRAWFRKCVAAGEMTRYQFVAWLRIDAKSA